MMSTGLLPSSWLAKNSSLKRLLFKLRNKKLSKVSLNIKKYATGYFRNKITTLVHTHFNPFKTS
jgi:hypothetical protein